MPNEPSRTIDRIHRAEAAHRLLNDDIFAEALTALRTEAFHALATADVDDKTALLRQQAVVRVTGDIRGYLESIIMRSGAMDGGYSAESGDTE